LNQHEPARILLLVKTLFVDKNILSMSTCDQVVREAQPGRRIYSRPLMAKIVNEALVCNIPFLSLTIVSPASSINQERPASSCAMMMRNICDDDYLLDLCGNSTNQATFTVRALLRLLQFGCTPELAKTYQGTMRCRRKWKALKGCCESG
jgi:hypothetical protein